MKKKLTYKKIIILLTIVFFTLIFPEKSYCQKFSLSISPPLTEIVIKPGKSVLIAFTLFNQGDPQILSASVKSFEPAGQFGNIVLKKELEGPIRFSLDNSDLQLNETFFLKSNARQQLLLRIRAPEGAPEGDYYYSLIIQSNPTPNNNSQTLGRARASIGANILVTVTQEGSIEIKPSIVIFDTLGGIKIGNLKIYESSQPIPVILILKNQGKNLIKPQGKITLKGNFGEKAEFEILSQNILSQSQRQLLASPSANINLKNPATLTLSGFFVGYYQLGAEINFGAETKKFFAKTSFIALPFKLIIGLVFGILIAFFLIKKYSKKLDE